MHFLVPYPPPATPCDALCARPSAASPERAFLLCHAGGSPPAALRRCSPLRCAAPLLRPHFCGAGWEPPTAQRPTALHSERLFLSFFFFFLLSLLIFFFPLAFPPLPFDVSGFGAMRIIFSHSVRRGSARQHSSGGAASSSSPSSSSFFSSSSSSHCHNNRAQPLPPGPHRTAPGGL